MPAKSHHFLPRFLMEPFSVGEGKDARVWVYRADRPGFCTNIKNINTESYFHGKGSGLEERLAAIEGEFAVTLRNLQHGSAIDHERLTEDVWLLSVRNRKIRTDMTTQVNRIGENVVSEEYLSGVGDELMRKAEQDPLAMLSWFLKRCSAEDKAALTGVEEVFRDDPGLLLDSLRRAGGLEAIAEAVKPLRGLLSGDLVKGGHNEALSRLTAEGATKPSRLKVARWRIVELAGNLILGDAGPVSFEGDGSVHPALAQKAAWRGVVLPLHPTRALVGDPVDGEPFLLPDVNELNAAMAACSAECFVAAVQDAELQNLAESLIGTRRILDDVDLNEIQEGAISRLWEDD